MFFLEGNKILRSLMLFQKKG